MSAMTSQFIQIKFENDDFYIMLNYQIPVKNLMPPPKKKFPGIPGALNAGNKVGNCQWRLRVLPVFGAVCRRQ